MVGGFLQERKEEYLNASKKNQHQIFPNLLNKNQSEKKIKKWGPVPKEWTNISISWYIWPIPLYQFRQNVKTFFFKSQQTYVRHDSNLGYMSGFNLWPSWTKSDLTEWGMVDDLIILGQIFANQNNCSKCNCRYFNR